MQSMRSDSCVALTFVLCCCVHAAQRDLSLTPTSVKQLLDATWKGSVGHYHGQTLSQVSIVACLYEQEQHSTHVEFFMEDGSGTIRALKFAEEGESGEQKLPESMFHIYYKVRQEKRKYRRAGKHKVAADLKRLLRWLLLSGDRPHRGRQGEQRRSHLLFRSETLDSLHAADY